MMDREQIKSVIKDVLTIRLSASIIGEERIDSLADILSMHLIRECEWSARVSANYSGDRVCPVCHGPIEDEEPHACLRCKQSELIRVWQNAATALKREIDGGRGINGGSIAAAVERGTRESMRGMLRRIREWYTGIRAAARGIMSQTERLNEDGGNRVINRRLEETPEEDQNTNLAETPMTEEIAEELMPWAEEVQNEMLRRDEAIETIWNAAAGTDLGAMENSEEQSGQNEERNETVEEHTNIPGPIDLHGPRSESIRGYSGGLVIHRGEHHDPLRSSEVEEIGIIDADYDVVEEPVASPREPIQGEPIHQFAIQTDDFEFIPQGLEQEASALNEYQCLTINGRFYHQERPTRRTPESQYSFIDPGAELSIKAEPTGGGVFFRFEYSEGGVSHHRETLIPGRYANFLINPTEMFRIALENFYISTFRLGER